MIPEKEQLKRPSLLHCFVRLLPRKLDPGSTVVEPSTHNLKIKASNPDPATGRGKMVKKLLYYLGNFMSSTEA